MRVTKKKWFMITAAVVIVAVMITVCAVVEPFAKERLTEEEASERWKKLYTENELNNGYSRIGLPAAEYVKGADTVARCKIISLKIEKSGCEYYEAKVIDDTAGVFKKGAVIKLCKPQMSAAVSLPDIREGMQVVSAISAHEEDKGHYCCHTDVTYYVTEDGYALYALGDRIEDLDIYGEEYPENLNFYGMPLSGMRAKDLMRELEKMRIQAETE